MAFLSSRILKDVDDLYKIVFNGSKKEILSYAEHGCITIRNPWNGMS